MKQGRSHSCRLLHRVRLLALTACMSLGAAHADEYGDVAQLLREGKLAEAQTRVERHLATKPRDPQMRLFKGVIQRESGRLADAMVTFTRLSEDHPELPEPYNNLAVIHAAQGQYDKARIALEKALRTNPSYATAHENLADIYARLASQAYSKALQIEGGPAPSPARLALIRELATVPGGQPRTLLATAPVTPAAKPVPAVQARPAPAATPAPPAKPAAAAPVVAPAPATPSPPAAGDASREVEQAVRAWARAWSDRNMSQYLAAYDKAFEIPGQQSRSAWEQDRRLRITGKSRITVNLLELQIAVKGNRAVAKFRQDYKADALAVLSRKTLELARTGDRWLIVKESSGG